MKLLLFDTETTGLPKFKEQAHKIRDNWPHIVSIAWIIIEGTEIIKKEYFIIKPMWDIPSESTKIHGITYEKAMKEGSDLCEIMDKFWIDVKKSDCMIAHNIEFDINVLINAEMWDLKRVYPALKKMYCTMELSRSLVKLPFHSGTGFKSPKLSELYEYVTKKPPVKNSLHNSLYDTEVLAEIILKSTTLRVLIGLPAIPTNNINESTQKSGIMYI